ncbi:DNA gyrase subunit A [Patescibacteria group bacterium]|nr:DNA gyrase subunit A [Patescibacteria group bacterium]
MAEKISELIPSTKKEKAVKKSYRESETSVVPAVIEQADITDQMQKAYLDYAMSVIVSRALPDVRDGLKPVHRRIIYAMQDQNMLASGKFHKCAAVVGEVLKKYHPHGDVAVYDSLVRMGQDFSLRYPLIVPQGNFGSIDGDPPAAMRYTESKLDKITEELFKDIDKETVDFELNDLQNYEPSYLPSLLPNLLLNGSAGIAVGMATNIPPHHLGELIDALIHMIDNADVMGRNVKEIEVDVINQVHKLKVIETDFSSHDTVQDMAEFIKGPDFPTGGIIFDQKEMLHMYMTGRGRVVTRAKMEVDESKAGRVRIIVSEIPYQVNKATLLTRIAELVKEKKIEGIVDLRDESSRNEIRVVIELKKGVIPKKIENSLYKYTQLQSTFNTNMVALVHNEPKLLNLKTILEEFVKHRQIVIVRRTIFLLKKDKHRQHILLGLKIALDNLDEVIALIRASKDAETAKVGLMKKFDLSEIQAQAILDMQLRKLAALERKKLEDELKEVSDRIADYEALLVSPERIMNVLKTELIDVKGKYPNPRKTKVVKGKVGEISEEDLVVSEPCIITISQSGYIKRLKEDAYRKQGRGGTGVTGAALKEEDQIAMVKSCNTHDWALFFTNTGKVYKLRIWEIPEYARQAKGTPLVNFLSIKSEERVEAFLAISNEKMSSGDGFVFLATKYGVVKKTELSQFDNIRVSGIIAINLSQDDRLVFAELTSGKDEVLLTTANGQSIKFSEDAVRAMGRSAGGVTGIKMKDENDLVVGAIVVPEKGHEKLNILVITQKGYGKKTSLKEYKTQNRAGSGILTYKVTSKTGLVVAARGIRNGESTDLLIATESGMFIRVDAKQVPVLGRATQGVRLIKLREDDKSTSVAVIVAPIEQE